MTAKHVGAAIAAAWLVAASTAAVAAEKPIVILAKPGGSLAQRQADKAECDRIVDKSPGSDMPAINATGGPVTGPPTMAGAAAGAIVILLFGLIDSGRAQSKGATFCLENMGYTAVTLTDAERAEYLAQSPDRQPAWEQRFLAQDLAARIAAIRTPKVPPLPDYRDAPMTIGGLRFLVDGFTAATGPVTKGGTLVTGKVERSRTAVLAADFTTIQGPVLVTGKAGAVFHQVDYRPQRFPLLRVQGATWCGPVEQVAAGGGPAPSVYCFTSYRQGYVPFRPTGFAWLAGLPGDGFVLPLYDSPIRLEERAADDLGPIDFSIELETISPTSATLIGYAKRNGQRVKVWVRRLKPGQDNKIIVPLWTRRLVLSFDPAGSLRAAIDDKGDGTSLRDAW